MLLMRRTCSTDVDEFVNPQLVTFLKHCADPTLPAFLAMNTMELSIQWHNREQCKQCTSLYTRVHDQTNSMNCRFVLALGVRYNGRLAEARQWTPGRKRGTGEVLWPLFCAVSSN